MDNERISNSISSALIGSKLLCEKEIVSKSMKPPAVSGVYFLVKEERVIYVGQSENVFNRVGIQFKKKDFDSFYYIECGVEDLDLVESLYIHAINPPLNKNWGFGEVISAPISLNDIISRAGGGA